MKIEKEWNFGTPRSPLSFMENKHDRLVRCKACGLKYDASEIQLFGGHHICRFCIKDLEINSKGEHNV